VVPHFWFDLVEKGFDNWFLAVQFGFGKAKYVGLNGVHMEEWIDDVGAVVMWAQSVDVLEIKSDDLGLPSVLRGVVRSVCGCYSFPVISVIEKVL
jgi:hypothetical protein